MRITRVTFCTKWIVLVAVTTALLYFMMDLFPQAENLDRYHAIIKNQVKPNLSKLENIPEETLEMGWYSSDTYRACYLVIDPGVRYYNWTQEQAEVYLFNYSSIAQPGVEKKVDRYTLWPGQATAYKVCDLKIRELRHHARSILGDRFDIGKFHSILLMDGAVPLKVMERNVLRWIEDEKDTLEKIMSEFWTWRMETTPEFASTLNIYKYNDRLNSYKYEKFDTDRIAVRGFKHRLSNIQRLTLENDKKVSYDILQNILDVFLAGYKWKDYQSLNPINFLEGWFVGFDQFISRTTYNTQEDFVHYARRIELAPNQLEEMMNLSTMAIQKGHVSNNVSVSRIPDQIDAMVKGTVEESELFAPFNASANEIFESPKYRDVLKKRLTKAISEFLKKLKDVKKFLQEVYMPRTRAGFGIGTTENGRENYQACLYFHTSVHITPEEVHQTGLNEVARIEKLIRDKMENVGFARKSSIQDMYENLTSNASFLIEDPNETLARFRSIIFDRIAPKIPQYLSNPPNLPLEVRASGSDGVGGEYLTGTADGSRPGVFYANVYKPSHNPTFTMVALSLHEAIPGHHLAESYGILADAPEFRKYFEWLSYPVPYFFPFYNAFAEGWALYAEFLGEEMGIYQNDYEMLGRYSEEMLRAARLVIDTGIHHYNWTREQAIAYLQTYTSQTADSAAIEIDRYATWPGQACGYKIGELKIKELRKKASDQLGVAFNLQDFHYTILKNGAMPLDILERIIDEWIKSVLSEHDKGKPNNIDNVSSAAINSADSIIILVFVSYCMCMAELIYLRFVTIW